jgi:hypothetical protein
MLKSDKCIFIYFVMKKKISQKCFPYYFFKFLLKNSTNKFILLILKIILFSRKIFLINFGM